MQPSKFRNGWVISSHTLPSMWLLTHAGIKLNHVSERGPRKKTNVVSFSPNNNVNNWKIITVCNVVTWQFLDTQGGGISDMPNTLFWEVYFSGSAWHMEHAPHVRYTTPWHMRHFGKCGSCSSQLYFYNFMIFLHQTFCYWHQPNYHVSFFFPQT